MKIKFTSKFSKRSQLLFQKFSRKKFAAFNTMHKVVHISTLAVTYTLVVSPFPIFAQSDSISFSKIIDLKEVEIIGQKDPLAFEEIPRMISVVSSREIKCAPSQSISDLLRYTGNIDIRQRGKSGIQSDVSIRGGSFDQSMILFNGVNITDPQTGHLSLFLPADIEAIKKIEILNGPSARIYGTNAFSGAINFITCPSDISSVSTSSSIGNFGFYSNTVTINLAKKKLRTLLYIGNSESEGDKPNTDFKKFNAFCQQMVNLPSGSIDFQIGFAQRSFGANSYYTPAFPDQYEDNKMIFSSLSYTTGNKIKFNPKIYWRRHYDRFELFREDEKWYRLENDTAYSNDTTNTFYKIKPYKQHNHHINDILGCEINFETKSRFGESNLRFHFRSENIYSTNIGYDRGIVFPVHNYPKSKYNRSDSRTNFDISANQKVDISLMHIAGGFLLNWNSYKPDEMHIFPGVDIIFDIAKNIAAVACYNYTLGLPTFSDLTYEDPNNTGNNKLVPYTQHSLEGGLKTRYKSVSASLQYFYNFGSDVIDWVWIDSLNQFKATNIPEFQSQGIEATSFIDFAHIFGEEFPIQSIRINYSYIDMDKDISGKITKYSNVRNMLSSMVQVKIFKGLIVSGNCSYLQREGNYFTFDKISKKYIPHEFKPYLLVDAKIAYTFRWITIYAECTNLTDQDYIDAGSIYQPGRWITGGIKVELTSLSL
jgi:vitamin B12 transporter